MDAIANAIRFVGNENVVGLIVVMIASLKNDSALFYPTIGCSRDYVYNVGHSKHVNSFASCAVPGRKVYSHNAAGPTARDLRDDGWGQLLANIDTVGEFPGGSPVGESEG